MRKVIQEGLLVAAVMGIVSAFGAVRVGGFWREEFRRQTVKWIPHCIRQMEKGGRGEEFLNLVATAEKLAGKTPSVKFKGRPWSDAYPYNTVEAACLALEVDPGNDVEWQKAQAYLRAKIDEWIPIFLAAQEPSGYIHSFHDLNGRPHFKRVSDHEFYVMGYFIEMGIAHMRLTGGRDRRLFDAAIRCADHLDATFGPAPKRTWTNGHPGIEYAFLRLADAVNRWDGAGKGDKYARLAQFFVRTQHSQKVGVLSFARSYNQSEQPAENMCEASGHAVRACYFYTAIEGIGRRCADHPLAAAADRLFDSTVDRKMYLTGGVGSSWNGEAFGPDYVLPHGGYCESCAGCGLAFWCIERAAAHPGQPRPWDVYERVLYNNVLGAVSQDGVNFFYQNPLTSSRRRGPWHGCPCCVGNIPRTLLALKDNIVSVSPDGRTLYVNNYMDIETDDFKMETGYPLCGKVRFTLKRGKYDRILARFPNRAESKLYRAVPEVEHGYREVTGEWELPLPEQTVTAIPEVKVCAGLQAIQRGPIVYSWEGPNLDVKVPNHKRLNNGGQSRVWMPRERGGERRGCVGFQTWNTAAEFKDISVTDPNGKVLWSGLPEPEKCARGADGKWSVVDGVIRQANPKGGSTELRFGSADWTDYTFRCKARKLSGLEGFGLHVRNRGDASSIWANYAGWVNRYDAIETRGYIFNTPRKVVCKPVKTNVWYDLEVTVVGDRVTMKIDGRKIFDKLRVPEL